MGNQAGGERAAVAASHSPVAACVRSQRASVREGSSRGAREGAGPRNSRAAEVMASSRMQRRREAEVMGGDEVEEDKIEATLLTIDGDERVASMWEAIESLEAAVRRAMLKPRGTEDPDGNGKEDPGVGGRWRSSGQRKAVRCGM